MDSNIETTQQQPAPPAVASKDGLGDNTRDSNLKRDDQIKLLELVAKYTDTGEWGGTFTYPNCGWDLVQMGLASEDKKITPAGRAALWLLSKGADPTTSKAVETFVLPMSPNGELSDSRDARSQEGPTP